MGSPTVAEIVDATAEVGRGEIKAVTVAMSASYATGGDPVTFAQLGLRVGSQVHGVWLQCSEGYVPEWIPSATGGLVKVYEEEDASGPLVEVANAFDLAGAGVIFRGLVFGR